MAHRPDHMALSTYDQQSDRPIHLGGYNAKLAEYSVLEVDPSPNKDVHDRRILFDPSYDPESAFLSLGEQYLHNNFFAPESFSTPPTSPTARSPTSTIHWTPESGSQPCSPDGVDAKIRKERRRAQNRMAQRAYRDRKEKVIESLSGELQRLLALNQSLSNANAAYARQISELKETIESTKLLDTPPNSVLTGDTLFELDKLELLEHSSVDGVVSLQAFWAESWLHWQDGERVRFGEATVEM